VLLGSRSPGCKHPSLVKPELGIKGKYIAE
jgi:hypothetical protein